MSIRNGLFTCTIAIAILIQVECVNVGSCIAKSDGKPDVVMQYSHISAPSDMSFAAHAPFFAVGGGSGHIDIWNTDNWVLQQTIDTGLKVTIRNCNAKLIALSPDGNILAYINENGEVQLWDVKSGKLLRQLQDNVGSPVSVIWSLDGKMIAAGGSSVKIWDAKTGKMLRIFPGSGDIAFSTNGKLIGTAEQNDAFLFEIATGRKIRTFHDKSGVSGPIAISPDGKLVATGGEDPYWTPPSGGMTETAYAHQLKVKIWDTHTGRRLRILPGHYNLGGGTKVLEFTPDGKRLFSGGDGYVALWNIKSGKAIRKFNNSNASAISSNGKIIAITQQPVSIYSAATGKSIVKLPAPPLPVRALSFSPDGKLLASADQTATSTGIRLWDVKNGRLARVFRESSSQLHDISFLTGNKLLSNGTNGIYVWHTYSGKLLEKRDGPIEYSDIGKEFRWMLMTPDGSKTISESGEAFQKAYKVRDAHTGKLLSTIPTGMGWLPDATFSQDGRYMSVATNHRPMTVAVWSLNTGRKVSELQDVGEGAVLMYFSPDGKTIAGSIPGLVQMPEGKQVTKSRIVLWNRDSGKIIQQVILEENSAQMLAYSPDGQTLAAAIGSDIHLYNAESLQETGAFQTDNVPITSIALSPDGNTIASGDEAGNVRLWDAGTFELNITMVGLPSTNGENISPDWYAYTPEGFYDWSQGVTKLIKWRSNGKLYPASAFEKAFRRKNILSHANQ